VSSNRLSKLRSASPAERRLFAEAVVRLGIGRAATVLMPFRRTARLLGLGSGESVGAVDDDQAKAAARIGWALQVAAARTPWQSTCLAQAVAATSMLRRRDIPATLFLGVARDPSAPSDLAAHAWVRCGDAIITGAAERDRFTPVGAFCTGRSATVEPVS
jgi:hypothetical protein